MWKDFQEKVNGELIGNLGNLINRTLSFVVRYYDGMIPEANSDSAFWEKVRAIENGIATKLDRAELRDAFRDAFELSSLANKAFQDGEPWKQRKENPDKAAMLIRDLCFVLRDLAVIVHPYLPATSARILAFFGKQIGIDGLSWSDIGQPEGLDTVTGPEVLFAKLEDELVEQLRERYAGSQKERLERDATINVPSGKTSVPPAEGPAVVPEVQPALTVPAMALENDEIRFAKTVDLRVAEIKKIERHPKADKLYIETLDIGGEERVIISGLVPFYTEEQLLGKRIIVVYNLKAAKLRGIESRGMLLAASSKNPDGTEMVDVLDAGDVATGTRVQLCMGDKGTVSVDEAVSDKVLPEIDIDTFFSIPIKAQAHRVLVGVTPLCVAGKELQALKVSDGEVG